MNRWIPTAMTSLLLGGTSVAHALGNLTDITLYDRSEHRSLPVYEHHGRYYVVGRPGNEYQIQIRNQSGGDLLTVVSVDGVNVISGETANWDQSGYVLNAWDNMDIKGWRKSLERTAAFYFTRLPDSYAARTGRPDNVGVIGLAVFQRKPVPILYDAPLEQEDRAADASEPFGAAQAPAPATRSESAGGAKAGELAEGNRDSERAPRKQRLGTGHGRSESSYARYTTFERATAAPAEIITIYYDSYRNLIAQGVIPDQRDVEPLAATPFPGRFVPDPTR